MKRQRLSLITFIALSLALSAFAWAQPRYQMVDLGDNKPVAINRDGVMAGNSQVSHHAILIEGNVVTDLGTLGGVNSSARGINAKKTVVGGSEDENTPPDTMNTVVHAFVWTEANGMQALVEPTGSDVSLANAINDSDVIAGSTRMLADDGSTVHTAVRWVVGSPQILASDLENAAANTVNKLGFIGGSLNHAAVVWRPNGSLVNLGTFGYPDAAVVDLNDRNVALIVVHQDVFPNDQTSLWRYGQLEHLPPVPGSYQCNGRALNNSAVVVGQCYLNETPPSQIPVVGAVWVDSVAYNLNTLVDNLGHLQITVAWDINNQGEIVAQAQGGETQFGVLLIPQPSASHD